jgi:peptide/nickel transport system ATP-binding protein
VPLLQVNSLTTAFSLQKGVVEAVSDVSFSLEAGECLGLVGESGCGKTTTGLSLMRILPANGRITGGSIMLEGRDLAGMSEKEIRTVRGNQIALIPQDPMTSLNPLKKIVAQIGEGLIIHKGATKSEARLRALEVLKMVEMPNPEERLDQYPHELSGGLRQRVMIAMALVCQPQILIADEPTTALDVTIQAQILDLLDDIREKYGMATILITHDMGVIAGRTDRVAVMYAGRLIEETSTEKLFTSMRHPYSQALLGAIPSMAGSEQPTELVTIPGATPNLSELDGGCRFAPRCRYATDECRQSEPRLELQGENHRFACFHPVDGPLAEEQTAVVIKRRDISQNPEIVRVEDLVKSFSKRRRLGRQRGDGVKAVSGISLSVRLGETLGIVGESGCGKTTIGRLIVNLETPTAGTITFPLLGENSNDRRALARERQMMFQDPYASLDPRKRVLDIVAEPLDIQGVVSQAERNNAVARLISDVGLPADAVSRFPHEFSGGQRQRIGLARALALQPRLIIADEPVSALDVSIQAQILNTLDKLRETRDLSMIFISHDLAVVRHVADRIAVMYLGKIVEVGTATEVFSRPLHHYTEGLLRAVPIANVEIARKSRGQQIKGELPSASDPPSGCRFRTRCPQASDICAQTEPPLVEMKPGHFAACHFPLR